jgi:DNA-binding response OmpR family regulator
MKIKVLLVDDEKKFATMLAKRLALREIDIDYVHNGPDAIAKVENSHYDLVILDVKMPGMGGIELKRILLKMAPTLKVIFLTGHGSQTDFETGTSEGAVYMAKPLQIDALVQQIHHLLAT